MATKRKKSAARCGMPKSVWDASDVIARVAYCAADAEKAIPSHRGQDAIVRVKVKGKAPIRVYGNTAALGLLHARLKKHIRGYQDLEMERVG